jgi:hypothetical protein
VWQPLQSINNRVELFKKVLPLVTALRSDALRERHWQQVKP